MLIYGEVVPYPMFYKAYRVYLGGSFTMDDGKDRWFPVRSSLSNSLLAWWMLMMRMMTNFDCDVSEAFCVVMIEEVTSWFPGRDSLSNYLLARWMLFMRMMIHCASEVCEFVCVVMIVDVTSWLWRMRIPNFCRICVSTSLSQSLFFGGCMKKMEGRVVGENQTQ